jgi:hypothetical protein
MCAPSFSSKAIRNQIFVFALFALSVMPMFAVSRFLDAPFVSVGVFNNASVVADFNNDGIDDIATAGSANSSDFVSVLLGKGDGTFETAKTFNTGSGPGGIAVGDLNGDGKLDIVTSDFGIDDGFSNIVSVLLGNGDGTFQAHQDFVAGPFPNSVAIADFNNDGKLDLVVGNNGQFSLLLGNGNGTFKNAVFVPSSRSTISVTTGDFNRDGKQDVAIADQLDKQIGIFLGNGDGTFQARKNYSVGDAVKVVIADLNGDSLQDLVVSNFQANSVSVLVGNGDGTFQSPVDTTLPASPGSLVTGDFNGDHKTDVAVSEFDELFNGFSALGILLGNGNGTFKPGINYGATGSLASGNFNQDTATDLVGTSGLGVELFFGSGDGTFQARRDFAAGSSPQSVATADLNGDNKLDLAVPTMFTNSVSVLKGNGDGSFQPYVTYATGKMPSAVAIGDVSNDKKKDLVVSNSTANTISVLLGNGDGSFQFHVDYPTGPTPTWIALADVNKDGKLDAITANKVTSGTVSVLLGNGNGTFGPHVEYATGKNPTFVLVDDLNGDGKLDLAVADSALSGGPSSASILLGNGDGTFQPHVDYQTSADVLYLAEGDVNSDGKKDLIASTGPILLNNGDGTFTPAGNFDSSAGGSAIVAADFNGDGRIDLLSNGGVFESVTNLLIGRGDGTFRAKQSFEVGAAPLGVVAGDFNGDGAVDAAVSDYNPSTVSILLNTGGSTVTVRSSENPSHAGDSVTFTSTVTPTFASSGTPTGNVTFKDGNTALGTVPLAGGQAKFTTSTLTVGSHKIVAQYSGDATFLRKVSQTLNQSVQP